MPFNRSNPVPAARTANLVTTESGDELLIYDPANQQIHHLDRMATLVWRNLDGRRTVADLVTIARTEVGPTVNADSIRLALDKFHEANLLAGPLADGMSPARPTRSRRRLLKEAGLVGIAVPVIASVTAPTASAQASCLPLNSACGTGIPCCLPHQCVSGRCCRTDGQSCTDNAQCCTGLCFQPSSGSRFCAN
jgi:Coenzyme PQQ synthesis protein D (PqqD)